MLKPVFILLLWLFSVQLSGQNTRVTGYKGIWFTLGQYSAYGDKYSGGLGTYTSSHNPVAIYSKAVDKTFFVYGGTTSATERHLLIMISYYDHKKKVVPRPVIVYDKQGVDDPHDNAAISIDDSGYIRVFVSGRNTSRPGFIFKSKLPYTIDQFEQIGAGEMTYPQPWNMHQDGYFYLYTKYTKGRELYWTTSRNGADWEPAKKLAGMGGHYQVSTASNGKVFTAFNYHPGGDVNKRTNIYLLQTADMGKTWKSIGDSLLGTPLTKVHNPALVKDYEAEGKLVYLNDINVDGQGNPVILAVVSKGFEPGPKGDPREWTIIHWKNGQWHFHPVCNSTHNYDMGSVYIEKDRWLIIGPTAAGPQPLGTGGEMVLWESKDEGITWKHKRRLTSNSTRNHSYARRPLHAQDDFYAFWADGNADELSPSKLYYCNKKGDVFMLPYDMPAEEEKPKQVK